MPSARGINLDSDSFFVNSMCSEGCNIAIIDTKTITAKTTTTTTKNNHSKEKVRIAELSRRRY